VYTMAITKEHIRFSIHFAFHLKKNDAEATTIICVVYGENAVSRTTCKRSKILLRRFQSWRWIACWTSSKDWNRRIASTAGYKFYANWKGACRTTWRSAASHFRTLHLHMMGRIQKEGKWVPHELSEDKNRRREIALSLLSKFQKKDFLHKIIRRWKVDSLW